MSARQDKPPRCDWCERLAVTICARQIELVGACLTASLQTAIVVLNDRFSAQVGDTLANCIVSTARFGRLIEVGEFDIDLARQCVSDLGIVESKLVAVDKQARKSSGDRSFEIGEIRDCIKTLDFLLRLAKTVRLDKENTMPRPSSDDRKANHRRPAPSHKLTVRLVWGIGSFFLLMLIVVVAALGVLAYYSSLWALPIVLVASTLLYAVVGAFILRTLGGGGLSEKSFMSLMLESYKLLPLLKQSIQNDFEQEADELPDQGES